MNGEEPKAACCGKAKSVLLWALVIVNVALVTVLLNRHAPENRAQAAMGVNPADLLAVPGNLPGFSNGVVFLIDNSSSLMTAISYDGPTNKITWLPQPLDIARIAQQAGGVRGR